MSVELINELYNLIQTKDENLMEKYNDKFKVFFDNCKIIENDIDNPKIYFILEYMLKYSKGLFNKNEIGILVLRFNNYLKRNFNKYCISEDIEINNILVSKFFEMFVHYNNIKDILKEKDRDKLDEFDNSVIDEFFDKKIIRDFVSYFISVLNSGFFVINEHIVSQILKFIRNNEYIEELYDKSLDNDDRDYISIYIKKFILIKDFSTKEELSNDKMIYALLKGNIRNEELYNLLIEEIDIDIILKMYNDDIDSILSDIEKSGYNQRVTINHCKITILKKILCDAPIIFFKYFYKHKDEESSFISLVFKDMGIDRVIDFDIAKLDEEFVLYIYDNYPRTPFIMNFYNYYKNKDVSEEIKKRLDKISDFNEVYSKDKIVELLRKVFIDNYKLSETELANICSNLTNIITNDNVRLILFSNEKKHAGYCLKESKIIGYAFDYFLGNRTRLQDSNMICELLNTIFHECIHYIQFKNKPITEDEKNYHKEEIIRKYYPNYYEKNYKIILSEKDARIKAYELCHKFLEENIPEACATYDKMYEEEYKHDLELSIRDKQIFGSIIKIDIDRIFNRLVFFHPEIKDEYPYLFEQQKTL